MLDVILCIFIVVIISFFIIFYTILYISLNNVQLTYFIKIPILHLFLCHFSDISSGAVILDSLEHTWRINGAYLELKR